MKYVFCMCYMIISYFYFDIELILVSSELNSTTESPGPRTNALKSKISEA